jgi:hypothetical protein
MFWYFLYICPRNISSHTIYILNYILVGSTRIILVFSVNSQDFEGGEFSLDVAGTVNFLFSFRVGRFVTSRSHCSGARRVSCS